MSAALGPSEITRLLGEWNQGDPSAFERLMPLVYDELRAQARQQLRVERPGYTLQPTALVNEFYLRLVEHREADWQNRAHFFGAAAKLMRRIIVDYARKRRALKRDAYRVGMEWAREVAESPAVDIIEAVDQALERLAERDPVATKIVELHFFLGMTVAETAEVVGVSAAMVKREWNFARAWLATQLSSR